MLLIHSIFKWSFNRTNKGFLSQWTSQMWLDCFIVKRPTNQLKIAFKKHGYFVNMQTFTWLSALSVYCNMNGILFNIIIYIWATFLIPATEERSWRGA